MELDKAIEFIENSLNDKEKKDSKYNLYFAGNPSLESAVITLLDYAKSNFKK